MFFSVYKCAIRKLYSFPTRRSSDLSAAGAQGEWTALLMIRAFHEANGDWKRTKVIIPDSAHGTNPASATVADADRKSTRLNSSHVAISYAVFCVRKKNTYKHTHLYI